MIKYQEKGEGLSNYLASFGIELAEVYDGGMASWQANQPDDFVNSKIDEYNPWQFEKAKKLDEINEWFVSAVAQLTAGTTQTERDSWSVQVNEAYGLRPISMLAAMAEARGVPLDELVAKVKQKSELFAAYYGALQGKRDALEDLVKSFPISGDYHRLPDLWALKCTG